ncbi:RHE_PE00001 family protein [Ensifer soli]|uniref:RHE_PE00001 family protein n=1 Tax=Ciceribacter sp. sgz301302 TaxID=3342379 RepID=UPI0035B81114
MSYDLAKLPIQSLLKPISAAGTTLARLDERIARSEVGSGFLERAHFADACASLWTDGELVHLEDLVLHDASHDIRTPTHELTIARDVLRTRRRIAAQPPGWALSPDGLRSLRRHNGVAGQARPAASLDDSATESKDAAVPVEAAEGGEGEDSDDASVLDAELAAIDAVLARSEAVLKSAAVPTSRARERDPLVYDLDWDEDARLEEWRTVLRQAENLPPVLQAIVALDAWSTLEVLQHAPWLGRHLAASILRQAGVTTGAHLVAINIGLKTIPVDRRRHRSREVRLLAIADGLIAAAEIGLKEHDRLALARKMMERKLSGRRTSSKLPELVELVMATPLVHAGTIKKTLGVTPQAARRIVAELGLREMTGRGRFRAWGIM